MMKDLYGLVGHPLSHSFSKGFFNEKFKTESIAAEYVNFDIPDISQLETIINDNPNLKGLNVTIPYKESVIPLLNRLDEQAQEIGAVNVVKFIRNGSDTQLVGYNSDVIGFSQSIFSLLTTDHKKALILGTGGASKAVHKALLDLGLDVTFVSRTPHPNQFSYGELNAELMNRYAVIVNTTPVGMYPNIEMCPDIPYEYLTPRHLVYDLIYNPEETLFMKKAKDRGAIVKNGYEMLLLQALAAWDIWNR